MKLAYTVKLNGASVEFSGGIKNILNSYQDDFDIGINRDPAYMYGPLTPRTIYVGVRFGNQLSPETGSSISPYQGSEPGWGEPSREERRRHNRKHRRGGGPM
jgi:hypothetical protein